MTAVEWIRMSFRLDAGGASRDLRGSRKRHESTLCSRVAPGARADSLQGPRYGMRKCRMRGGVTRFSCGRSMAGGLPSLQFP